MWKLLKTISNIDGTYLSKHRQKYDVISQTLLYGTPKTNYEMLQSSAACRHKCFKKKKIQEKEDNYGSLMRPMQLTSWVQICVHSNNRWSSRYNTKRISWKYKKTWFQRYWSLEIIKIHATKKYYWFSQNLQNLFKFQSLVSNSDKLTRGLECFLVLF